MFHTLVTDCIRRVKQAVNAAVNWIRQDSEFIQPSSTSIVTVCSKFMGGNDGFGWRIASFRPKIVTKSCQWIPKVLIRLLYSNSSYLIYKWRQGKTLNDATYQGRAFP